MLALFIRFVMPFTRKKVGEVELDPPAVPPAVLPPIPVPTPFRAEIAEKIIVKIKR